jgi:4-hydroxy-3-methylbut-2-en-1-yl diphosphate synthase IspG/GcpE
MQKSGMPGEEYRDLVICNSCLWAASLLKGSRGFIVCPVCGNISLEIIPVGDYEAYTMNVRNKSFELEFKKDK